MYCDNCKHLNEKDNKYCIKCGFLLTKKRRKTEDILFVPEGNKSHTVRNIFLFIFFGSISFLLLLIVIDTNTIKSSRSPTDTHLAVSPEVFPLSYLSIKNIDSNWIGTGDGAYLNIIGTLTNEYSISAKNVQLRVDFYYDKNDQELFDTRYVTVPGVSYNGAFTFKEPIYGFSPTKQFWFRVRVISAD